MAPNKWLPDAGLSGTGKMSLTVYSESPTSIGLDEANSTTNKLKIYPNPSSGEFQIYLEGMSNEEVTLELNDISGRQVYSKLHKLNSGECTLKIESMMTGLYFFEVLTENRRILKKIVIE